MIFADGTTHRGASLQGFRGSRGVNKQSPRLHLITGSPPAFGRLIAGHVHSGAGTSRPRREPLSKFNNSYLRGIRTPADRNDPREFRCGGGGRRGGGERLLAEARE